MLFRSAGDVGGCSTWGVVVSDAGTACWGTWNGLASGAAAPLDVPVPKISLMSRPSSALISLNGHMLLLSLMVTAPFVFWDNKKERNRPERQLRSS